jgi:hypothetical protein
VVAQAERTERLLKVDLHGRGVVAVRQSVANDAQFEPDGLLTGHRRGGCLDESQGSIHEVRALVEVQRRFGGLAPRALLGGKLAVARTSELSIQVAYGLGAGMAYWPSQLWNGPFRVGLPESFASAVLGTLVGRDDLRLPCGTLLIDQAGFDPVESARPVFEQAAIVLGHVLEALVRNSSMEESVTRAIESW